jgi:hypothetical protein
MACVIEQRCWIWTRNCLPSRRPSSAPSGDNLDSSVTGRFAYAEPYECMDAAMVGVDWVRSPVAVRLPNTPCISFCKPAVK